MLFSWLKNRRRRKLLATPAPTAWLAILERIAHYRGLTDAEQERLRELVRIFVAEKDFEGCRGLEITDDIRVTVAALASLLLLGLQDEYFDNVLTVLMYPAAYLAPEQKVISAEVALEETTDRVGEAHYRGAVILSWADVDFDVRQAGRGSNLVFHEFAHQLDMLSGSADGVPPLPRRLRASWQRVMAREYKKLCRAADRGRETLIDPYGTTDPAEFFAVVTECFFDAPADLKREHPELYDLLREYYQQDPAARP